jgi:hypothetical protein
MKRLVAQLLLCFFVSFGIAQLVTGCVQEDDGGGCPPIPDHPDTMTVALLTAISYGVDMAEEPSYLMDIQEGTISVDGSDLMITYVSDGIEYQVTYEQD